MQLSREGLFLTIFSTIVNARPDWVVERQIMQERTYLENEMRVLDRSYGERKLFLENRMDNNIQWENYFRGGCPIPPCQGPIFRGGCPEPPCDSPSK